MVGNRLVNLALLYADEGRPSDAEPLLQRALGIYQKSFGAEHPRFAATLAVQARLRRDLGKYGEAEKLQKQALTIYEGIYGVGNVRTAWSLNELAALYLSIGQTKEAESVATKALAIREKQLGSLHPDVATSLNIVGNVQERLENASDAERLYRRALAIQETSLPAEHPDVAKTNANLGGLLLSQKKYDEAQKYLERALAIREASLSPMHPALAASLFQLSELYRILGRKDDSQKLFLRGRSIKRSGITEVPVYFATDRKVDRSAKGLTFGSEAHTSLTLGLATATVPKVQGMGRLPDQVFDATEADRIATPSLEVPQWTELAESARERLLAAEAFPKQLFVFVHGYNSSFEDAVRRAGQIAYDLNFDGPIFAFSWPSRHRFWDYLVDTETVDIAVEDLQRLLEKLITDVRPAKIHVVAHSMGNLVVLRALANPGMEAKNLSKIGQLINAAPDVAPNVFERLAGKIKHLGGELTVYASTNDKALLFSAWLGFRCRVGYISSGCPVTETGVETIDITAASMNWFSSNHSAYATSPLIVADIRQILAGSRPPDNRTTPLEVVMTSAKTKYWRLISK
jgi:esterase/lipase superfamily enzyme